MARDKRMANTITGMTGYGQVQPTADPSGGGYTDWFIAQFGRPGFTAELGHYQEETEVPLWAFDEIWGENRNMGLYLASEGYKLWRERYPIQPVQENLQLLKPVQLYNRPSDSFPTGAELGGTQVTADARLGDWVRVSTWMGPKWICLKPTDYLAGYAEDSKEKINLKGQTSLYSYPKAETSLLLGQVNPQEVTALKRWNSWVLIETWFGTSWIEEKQ
jgi:g-D-glutamyl-meso-diaminopimelate peptidase